MAAHVEEVINRNIETSQEWEIKNRDSQLEQIIKDKDQVIEKLNEELLSFKLLLKKWTRIREISLKLHLV